MIWDIIICFIFILGVVFAIMYILFMSMLSSTKFPYNGKLSFKQMNKLFWVFFKSYLGFSNTNKYDDKPW